MRRSSAPEININGCGEEVTDGLTLSNKNKQKTPWETEALDRDTRSVTGESKENSYTAWWLGPKGEKLKKDGMRTSRTHGVDINGCDNVKDELT